MTTEKIELLNVEAAMAASIKEAERTRELMPLLNLWLTSSVRRTTVKLGACCV
jgi:hypothetical protein